MILDLFFHYGIGDIMWEERANSRCFCRRYVGRWCGQCSHRNVWMLMEGVVERLTEGHERRQHVAQRTCCRNLL